MLLSCFYFPCSGPPRGEGEIPEKLGADVRPLPKTLTLFMTNICDFPYPIYDLIKNVIPYLWPLRLTQLF